MRLFKSFALLAAALAINGCSVGPRYTAPQTPPATYHSTDPRLINDSAFDPRWWKQFEDPVLDSLIQKSLAANTTIRAASARFAQSRAVYDERKLDRYPTVPVDATYTYAKEQLPGFYNDPITINTFHAGFDAYWELDLFGRVRHGIAAASSDSQAVEADLNDVKVSVIAELARNYFELRGAQWRLAVADRSLKNQKDTLRLTQLRRDAGVGEEQDVASAAARVAATDATIPLLELETRRAEYRLAVLTATRPGELTAHLSPHEYSPIDKSLPIGNAGDLLKRRPDVRAAERRLSAATERQGVAVAELFPEVSVSAFVGFVAGRGSLFFTTRSFATTASPGLTWSAFDIGRARARVRNSSAATDEALALYDETVLRALEEAENSFSNYHAQQERLVRLNTQAQQSKRAADIARLRYREGVIDFLSLLDAERTQLQAEDAVAESERDVYVAVIALYKALGGVPS
jgi:outer membrane protein, multidrug efflux system